MLFSLFLIYLPFKLVQRTTFAFFSILWNDKPNLKGSQMEKKIGDELGQAAHLVSAAHPVGENVGGRRELPELITGKAPKK